MQSAIAQKIGPAGGADGALGCGWVRDLQAAPSPFHLRTAKT